MSAAVSIYFFAIPSLSPETNVGKRHAFAILSRDPNGHLPPYEFVFDPDARATLPLPPTGSFRRESRASGSIVEDRQCRTIKT